MENENYDFLNLYVGYAGFREIVSLVGWRLAGLYT